MLSKTFQMGVDNDVISQWMNRLRTTKQSLFSFFPRVTLGLFMLLLCDRLIDLCAIWDPGVFLPAAGWKRASDIARRRLNEAETVSGVSGAWPGACGSEMGVGGDSCLSSSLWWAKVLWLPESCERTSPSFSLELATEPDLQALLCKEAGTGEASAPFLQQVQSVALVLLLSQLSTWIEKLGNSFVTHAPPPCPMEPGLHNLGASWVTASAYGGQSGEPLLWAGLWAPADGQLSMAQWATRGPYHWSRPCVHGLHCSVLS